MRKVRKAIPVLVFLTLLTVTIGFFSQLIDYRNKMTIASDHRYFLEANDIRFDVHSQGIFSRSSKVLVATTDLEPQQSIVFAASRNSNIVKSFVVDKESGKLFLRSEFKLSHNSRLYEIVDGIKKSKYLVFDLIVEGANLFISVVATYPGDKLCDEIKILSLEFDSKGFFLSDEREVWKYDGCVKWKDNADPGGNLSLRLASDKKSIFMSIGLELLLPYTDVFPNNALEHMPSSLNLALEQNPIFGSLIKIKLNKEDSSGYKIIASGLRAPQGLVFDSSNNSKKRLWISDHGPRGGDEINVFDFNEQLPNYGWPDVSLGTFYTGDGEGILDAIPVKFGSHEDFIEPIFYWTPSIAPSQLAIVPKSFMRISNQWNKGDLLVTTLKDQSLHKLVFNDNGKVWSDERIFIGERIRDIDVLSFALVIGTDSGKVVVMRPLKLTYHSGSFPPLDKFTDPQRIDFFGYVKNLWEHLRNQAIGIVSR